MINSEVSKQKLTKILAALDNMLQSAPWDESNFIKIIGKKIREIRNECATHASFLGEDRTKVLSNLASRVALRSFQREVFIGLYSVDGSNLQSWERIIANLPQNFVSRPIYGSEAEIKALLKSKASSVNVAYVSVYVSQNDIFNLVPDKIPVDKLGNTLLSLKDSAINIDNIHFFYYQSSLYQYVKGRLVKE